MEEAIMFYVDEIQCSILWNSVRYSKAYGQWQDNGFAHH